MMPRIQAFREFLNHFDLHCSLTEKFGLQGVLVFTANNIYFDPWILANRLLQNSDTLTPLIAVNPVYASPFTAAKMVVSLASIFKRRVDINCIAGVSTGDLRALGDHLSSEERKDRLREYFELFTALLTDSKPFTQNGNYYKCNDLQLRPFLKPHLLPELYVSGASESSMAVAKALDAFQLTMPSTSATASGKRAIYVGVIARETAEEANVRANKLFPQRGIGEQALAHSMQDTDSTWKRQLHEQMTTNTDSLLSYRPFIGLYADSPFLIGSYEQVSKYLKDQVELGVNRFIINLPTFEEDFLHFAKVRDLILHG